MRRVVVVGILLVALVAPAAAGATPGPALAATLRERRAQLEELLGRLTRSRQQLRDAKRRERRVLGELEDIDRSREAAEQRLDALTVELARTRAQAQATTTQLAMTQRRLAEHQTRLGGRLRDIYKYGRTGYADVLLGSDNVGELITRWQFISVIVRADSRLVRAYGEDVAEASQLAASLLREQQQLAAAAAQTDSRRREILVQDQAKRATLTRLQQERTAYERMTRELEEDSHEVEVMVRRMQASAPRSAVALARSLAGFIWPARGVFTSGFGMRRHPIFGIRRMHTGQDIAASYGAPVEAASDGRVIYTGWFGGYGKIVVIDHGGGISTLYAHLSTTLTTEGAFVRQGQVIGRVGSTGYSTGPHVHFEVRVDGVPIDPARR